MASGGASLSPEDRVELLAVLAEDSDSLVSEKAGSTLLAQPREAFLAVLARADAAPSVFRYCAHNLGGKTGVADALAKNAACPPELLIPVANYLTGDGVQALLENLDRLTASPALPAALAACAAATVEQRHLLQEFHQAPIEESALAEVTAAVEPDAQRRQTLLQRLQRMSVVQRIQLALKGGREERLVLVRDPSKLVQRAVMQSPRLTETEIEAFAAMANLSDEVLRTIGKNRAYIKNYAIVRNLVNNPKAPLDITLHFLPRLTPQDLKILVTNRNINETLRSTAAKLERQRKAGRQTG